MISFKHNSYWLIDIETYVSYVTNVVKKKG